MDPDIVRPIDATMPGAFAGSETVSVPMIPHPCSFPNDPQKVQISAHSTLQIEWDFRR
jgi:hypothetical protein